MPARPELPPAIWFALYKPIAVFAIGSGLFCASAVALGASEVSVADPGNSEFSDSEPLDEDFLLFLSDWGESGDFVAPSELESLLPEEDTGAASETKKVLETEKSLDIGAQARDKRERVEGESNE